MLISKDHYKLFQDYQNNLQYGNLIPPLPKELDKQMILKLCPILDFLNKNIDHLLNFNLFIKVCIQKNNIVLKWFIKNILRKFVMNV